MLFGHNRSDYDEKTSLMQHKQKKNSNDHEIETACVWNFLILILILLFGNHLYNKYMYYLWKRFKTHQKKNQEQMFPETNLTEIYEIYRAYIDTAHWFHFNRLGLYGIRTKFIMSCRKLAFIQTATKESSKCIYRKITAKKILAQFFFFHPQNSLIFWYNPGEWEKKENH